MCLAVFASWRCGVRVLFFLSLYFVLSLGGILYLSLYPSIFYLFFSFGCILYFIGPCLLSLNSFPVEKMIGRGVAIVSLGWAEMIKNCIRPYV